MDANDLKLLFEVIDVKAQSKKNENQEDAQLRRFKEKWLFLITVSLIPVIIIFCIGFIIVKPDSSYSGIAMNGSIGLVMALSGYYVRGDR